MGGQDDAWIGEERGHHVGKWSARNAARGGNERRRLAPEDEGGVTLFGRGGGARRRADNAGTCTTRSGEARETRERRGMQRAVHFERDEAERASAQRDVGRDVGLVWIGRPYDDEAALEIDEVTRGQRVVRVDPQSGTAERIVRETERGPRREPREPALTDAGLDPEERRTAELGEAGLIPTS